MTETGFERTLDTSKPHPARVYDYVLGGKDHFDSDREAGDKILAVLPGLRTTGQVNRSFMHRVTRVLAREHGIRQWLDIGTGIPTEPNLHQVAQEVAPDARVVYIDNDPLVLKHSAVLMRSTREGRTGYVQADVREPEALLEAVELAEVLDHSRPIALSLNALLHFVPDRQAPYGVVRRLMAALPSGSVLAMTHATGDIDPVWERMVEVYNEGGTELVLRTREEFARFFDGLELISPGIVLADRWHPDGVGDGVSENVEEKFSLWAGVGVKP